MKAQPYLSRVLGLSLALIFMILTPVSLWLYDFGSAAFELEERSDLAVKVLVKTDLIPAFLASQTAEVLGESPRTEGQEGGESDISAVFHFLGEEEWEQIQFEMLPMSIYQPWVFEASESFENWMVNSQPYPEITLETDQFKERWDSVHGQNTVAVIFDALPPCTAQDVEDFFQRNDTESAGLSMALNMCRLPSPWDEIQYQIYQRSITFVVTNLPDEIQVPSVEEMEQIYSENEAFQLKNRLLILRAISLNAILLPGFVLLLITIIAVRSIHTWSVWWGIPLSFRGILTLPVHFAQNWLFPWSANLIFEDIPTSLRGELIQAVIQANNEIFTPLYWQAGLLLLAGILLLLIAIISRPKRSVQRDEI